MNLDNLLPPEPLFLSDDDQEVFANLRQLLQRRSQAQVQQIERQQLRRRLDMSRENDDASSDEEMDQLTKKVNGMTNLTPDESTTQELVKIDPAEVGMSPGYKNLYSGKEDKRGRFQWQTTIPEDLGKPAEDAESEKWAIIVRNIKVFNDPKKVLSIHSVVIQSPLLKELLKEVLAGYPGVTVGLKRLEFSGKFEPLIHRWAEYKAAVEQLKRDKDTQNGEFNSDERLKHAEILDELLNKEFKDIIDASTDLKNQGVMTYEHLWTLFQPGSFVYSKQQGQDRIFRLHSSRYVSHWHVIL